MLLPYFHVSVEGKTRPLVVSVSPAWEVFGEVKSSPGVHQLRVQTLALPPGVHLCGFGPAA